MRTSDHLAAAAQQFKELIDRGQSDLLEHPEEIRLTLQLRDLGAQQLTRIMARAIGDSPLGKGHRQVAEAGADLVASVQGRQAGLVTQEAPTDLAQRSLHSRTAQSWAAIVATLEPAVVQAGRAELVTAPTWRAVVADTATLMAALAWVDVELGRVAAWSGERADRALEAAADRIGRDVGRIRRQSRAAITLATGQPTPDGYHLAGRVEGVAAVTRPDLIPGGIDRASVLLERQAVLTGRQQEALHTAVAAIADRMAELTGRGGAADVAHAWRAVGRRHVELALAWKRADHVWCAPPGSGDAPGQLRAVVDAVRSLTPADLTPQLVRRTAGELSLLALTAQATLEAGLAQGHWLARRGDRRSHEWGTIAAQQAPRSLHDLLTGRPVADGLAEFGYLSPGDARPHLLGVISPQALTSLRHLFAGHETAAAAQRALRDVLGGGSHEPDAGQGQVSARGVLAGTLHLPRAAEAQSRAAEAQRRGAASSSSRRVRAAVSRPTTLPADAVLEVGDQASPVTDRLGQGRARGRRR